MYLIKSFFVFLFFLCCLASLPARAGMVSQAQPLTYWQRLDSARLAKQKEQKRVQDSIRQVQDSLQMLWIKKPDPDRPNQFLDSLMEVATVKDGDIFAWRAQFDTRPDMRQRGYPKHHRQAWIISVILLLILFFAVLKSSLSSQLQMMTHAFYSNRALLQLSKEENLYNSWPFVFLYILFGFTLGMLLFLAHAYLNADASAGDVSVYLFLSVIVLILFTLKIVAVRFLGFLFDVQRLVREYVSILYLSYFNTAILFLPFVLVAAFLPVPYMRTLLLLALILLTLIFALQFLRAVNSVIKAHRFPKFYLFLYFCTLEIGPIIVLIKILGF